MMKSSLNSNHKIKGIKMKNILLFIFLSLFLMQFTSFAQIEKYGRDIAIQEKTNISEILSDPSDFEGQTVLVEGKINDVCPSAGCWMILESDKEGQEIKIKVKDGDIVFPQEAIGKTALVEGTVYKIELTREEAVEYYSHVAEEKGEDFDPASVTGAVTLFQIKGLAAEIR